MDQIIKKDNLPVTIAVIGGGFCGILTAIHLMNYGKLKAQLYIINKGYPLVKGVAYNPHTLSLLLNVPNGKMSAFPDQPDHYVKWLKNENPHYAEENNLSSAFSTRQEYGNYLSHLWEHAINKIDSNKTINIVNDYADDITKDNGLLHISLREGRILVADVAILATGNANPGIPNGITRSMLKSKYYFANPWNKSCVENINTQGDILIIGAGLTAIDTIIGIKQRDFQDRIHTISPNGYRIKSWQEDKTPYTSAYMTEIVNENTSLLQLLRFFNKHRKIAMSLDQSVYAIVDSFRPHTQKIWQSLSFSDKQRFVKRLKNFWEKSRHRLPNHQYQIIEKMRQSGQLLTHKGSILSIKEMGNSIMVHINCDGESHFLKIKRVINCISPEINIRKQDNALLNNLAKKGIIRSGPCKIGIDTNPYDGSIPVKTGSASNLFAIGSNLKGVLWESTAVPELRIQAKRIADRIIESYA